MSRTNIFGMSWSRLALSLMVAGLLLCALAASIWLRQRTTLAPPSNTAALRSGPSAAKPSGQTVASYDVPAANPKYLAIPALGVGKARVIELGVKDNQIAAPDNLYDAGWYNGSSKPGQPGAAFIYGHVSGWRADGVFYNLSKLRAGDKISVTGGDNQVYTYQVRSTKTYAATAVDMAAVLSPIDPGKSGLNLMTCAGKLIEDTNEFDQRLVVFASLTGKN